MAFSERLGALAKKIRDMRSMIETEEATKNAFVMPFISKVLGYDVFNPNEVIPEFTADIGVKRGEKVDYAIFNDGQIQMLIECKKVGEPLDVKHASQLFRYFTAASARIAILTNGQEYQIFTDGDMPNRMDEKPFLVFDLLDMDRTLIPELQKLSKESFDLDSVLGAAEELKYIGGIRKAIASEVKEPSDDWVRFFVSQVYEGRSTKRIIEQFRPLVTKALNQYVGDQVNSRLKSALGDDGDEQGLATEAPASSEPVAAESASDEKPALAVVPDPDVDDGIVTTEEELEGFNIVRAIAVSEVAPERVTHRDAKTYMAILLDDNNRKPLLRMHLNGKSVKYVKTFEDGKDGTRRDIDSVIDIYKVAEPIRQTVRQYLDE